MQTKKIELNKLVIDKIANEESKNIDTSKIMKILKPNPQYSTKTIEVITNKKIIEQPIIEKSSKIIISPEGKKTIEETIEKTYGGTIEKKYIISTTKKNNSEIYDNKFSTIKSINTIDKNSEKYSGLNTEKNYYIIPDKFTYSSSSAKFSNDKVSSLEKESSKKSSNEKNIIVILNI